MAQRLARTRNGALIILPGRESLERHLEGGVPLDGQLSEPLLLSLFDPHSPGHDGAAVVEGNKVTRFAVRLPLSSAEEQLREVGTRHAAALGLSERCDALVIVVSEERGAISVAQGGTLRRLVGSQELGSRLAHFHEEVSPSLAPRPRLPRLLGAQWKPILLALTLASALWVLLGPAAQIIEQESVALVTLENLPPGYEVESVTPPEVGVTLSGPRRRLSLAQGGDLRIRVDATLAKLGRRTFQLNPEQVDTPRGIRPLQVAPTTVRVSLKTPPSGNAN